MPIAALTVLIIFAAPNLPLGWAYFRHWTGFSESAEFWKGLYSMGSEFRTPDDGMDETQRRVLKLQLYLLVLFLSFSFWRGR